MASQPQCGARSPPRQARRARHVTDTGRMIAERYGYEEAATPIFEFSDVFARTLGETSDIVTKEMYTFTDKGGDSATLRPEGTAGIARALISGGLSQNLPLKFFYAGPMFRYERPQKGRLRQFHQIGAELLGVADPIGDVEVIALGAAILDALDLQGNITLELNTLGNTQSRADYRGCPGYLFQRPPVRFVVGQPGQAGTQSVAYPRFQKRRRSPDRVRRANSMTAWIRSHAISLPKCAQALTPQYIMGRNSRLVRGLDYYCHTAFEFTTNALGAQRAVLAGGRYDGLVEQMGGPSTPGVGWASESNVCLC